MNKFWKGVLINIAGIYGVVLIVALFNGFQVFLFIPLIISFFELLVALILIFPQSTRKLAQIMLAASGIVFLIGIGVCSMYPFNFH